MKVASRAAKYVREYTRAKNDAHTKYHGAGEGRSTRTDSTMPLINRKTLIGRNYRLVSECKTDSIT